MRKLLIPGSSIAMSWMWGLGLFFSVHFTYRYGWIGLLCFAVPNALGLVLFGWVLARRAGDVDLKAWSERTFARYAPVFALYQVGAVALTLFALMAYFLAPLGLAYAPFAGLAVLAIGVLLGEIVGFRRLMTLHGIYFAVALIALVSLLVLAPRDPRLPAEAVGLPFIGFAVPLIVGLLVGPFFDVQQWQRAVELQRQGESIARGFAVGGGMFFTMLLLNGAATLAVTGGLDPSGFMGADGRLHAQSAVTDAVATAGGPAVVLYGLWVVLCVLSTFDSAQAALAWFVPAVSRNSNNALLAMLPPGLLASTAPLLVLAAAAALAAWYGGGHLEYFMILYASVFAACSAGLAQALYRRHDAGALPPATLVSGVASLLIISVGYFEQIPALMIVGSLMALLPVALDAIKAGGAGIDGVGNGDRTDGEGSLEPDSAGTLPADNTAPPAAARTVLNGAAAPTAPDASHDGAHDGFFDGKWFEVRLTATYADTNSVGNIYFANYVSWIGKTRELFFRHCMPSFDLKETPFYILTRNFTHKFTREAREFDQIKVRLRISHFNRKFVKLEHRLFDGRDDLLGEGEQSLMFVTSADYRLIDIPPDVMTAFSPHA